jgi:arylformamidase
LRYQDKKAKPMTKTVFLHYTQEELNRNFDQRAWVDNALEVIARYSVHSQATRDRLSHRANIAYGTHPDEVLDFFPAGAPGGPIQVFIHGGAWKNFTKDDYSFAADSYVPAGINTVVLNFSKLPSERLPTVVEQVLRGITWVHENAKSLGADPGRMFVSAQSSGAHLAAAAMQKGAIDFVRALTLVSGPYFLEPVTLSHRADYVKLDKKEVVELSPGLHPAKITCPVLLAYAENDTDEFQRQTLAFAEGLAKAGRLDKLIRCESRNHFELMEAFREPEHKLMKAIFEQMAAQPALGRQSIEKESS